MSTKERPQRDDQQTSLRPNARKLTHRDSDTLASPQSPSHDALIRRAGLHPASLAARDVLQLQRAVGNREVGRLLGGKARASDSQEPSVRHQDAPRKGNGTGLPDKLKAGVEALSGMAMDDVRVQYNSASPAAVQALAYTQGSKIFLGPGQEKHL